MVRILKVLVLLVNPNPNAPRHMHNMYIADQFGHAMLCQPPHVMTLCTTGLLA